MCKDSCQVQLNVRSWLSDDHRECAKWLVGGYMGFGQTGIDGGARFEELPAHPADMITEDDLNAVPALSIGFPKVFVQHLAASRLQHLREILMQIPADVAT